MKIFKFVLCKKNHCILHGHVFVMSRYHIGYPDEWTEQMCVQEVTFSLKTL